MSLSLCPRWQNKIDLFIIFFILDNKLIGYADDSTLMAVVPSPGVRVTVAESLIRDFGRVSEWRDLWGMKLNASQTKTMIVSRSRTMQPQSPPLTIGGTVLKESDDFVILGVIFDSKLTFEKHFRLVSRASQRFGILRKSWRVFHDRSLLERCFLCFVLPVLEYCSAVCWSAANTHLKLLERVVCGGWFLTGGMLECDIAHRRSVAVLCMLDKIRCNPMLPLNYALHGLYVLVLVTRGALVAHQYTYEPPGCRPRSPHYFCSPLSVPLEWSCWPRVWWCGTGWFQEQGKCFFIGLSCSIPTIVFYYFSISLLPVYRLVGLGSSDW